MIDDMSKNSQCQSRENRPLGSSVNYGDYYAKASSRKKRNPGAKRTVSLAQKG